MMSARTKKAGRPKCRLLQDEGPVPAMAKRASEAISGYALHWGQVPSPIALAVGCGVGRLFGDDQGALKP